VKPGQQTVNVSILGREFSVACADETRADLLAAASYLDTRMREIQRGGKVIGMERCAIMAALNIANELLLARRTSTVSPEVAERIRGVSEKIEGMVQEQKQLAL
jgi:cell division protein ZapA